MGVRSDHRMPDWYPFRLLFRRDRLPWKTVEGRKNERNPARGDRRLLVRVLVSRPSRTATPFGRCPLRHGRPLCRQIAPLSRDSPAGRAGVWGGAAMCELRLLQRQCCMNF